MKFSQALIFIASMSSAVQAANEADPEQPKGCTSVIQSNRSRDRASAIPLQEQKLQEANRTDRAAQREANRLKRLEETSHHTRRGARKAHRTKTKHQCPESAPKVQVGQLSITEDGTVSITMPADETNPEKDSCLSKTGAGCVKCIICLPVSAGFLCGKCWETIDDRACRKCENNPDSYVAMECIPKNMEKGYLNHCWESDGCVKTKDEIKSWLPRFWKCIKESSKNRWRATKGTFKKCFAPFSAPDKSACGKVTAFTGNVCKLICCPCVDGWYYLCNCGCCSEKCCCVCCKRKEDETTCDLCVREGPGCIKDCCKCFWKNIGKCLKATGTGCAKGTWNCITTLPCRICMCPINLVKFIKDVCTAQGIKGCPCELCKRCNKAAGIKGDDCLEDCCRYIWCCTLKEPCKYLDSYLVCCQKERPVKPDTTSDDDDSGNEADGARVIDVTDVVGDVLEVADATQVATEVVVGILQFCPDCGSC